MLVENSKTSCKDSAPGRKTARVTYVPGVAPVDYRGNYGSNHCHSESNIGDGKKWGDDRIVQVRSNIPIKRRPRVYPEATNASRDQSQRDIGWSNPSHPVEVGERLENVVGEPWELLALLTGLGHGR